MTHSFVQKPKVRAGFPSPFKAGGQVGIEWQEALTTEALLRELINGSRTRDTNLHHLFAQAENT